MHIFFGPTSHQPVNEFPGRRWLTPLVSWKACSSYSNCRFSFSLLERAIIAGLITSGPRGPKSFADLPNPRHWGEGFWSAFL
jgi:hypothetical protein